MFLYKYATVSVYDVQNFYFFFDTFCIYRKMCTFMKRNIILTEQDLHRIVAESAKRIIEEASKGMNMSYPNVREGVRERKSLNEAVDPVSKIQALIQQANDAYRKAEEVQGGDRYPLMDRDGSPYGLSGIIKLDGRGYVTIPFNGMYSEYDSPVKIRVLQKVGGKIKVINGNYWDEGWKDVRKMLNKIIKDAEIGIGNFENYDANWETANSKEEYKANKEALRNMNRKIGRRASSGMEYLEKNY